MKVLVIGGGGREHALCDALARSSKVEQVFCAPGNGGIEDVATCLPELLASDAEGLVAFAKREAIDLTVIGPEAPLVAGLADDFRAEGLRVFGPSRSGARLEGSKRFAKELMARHNIPTADYRVFDSLAEARDHVEQWAFYPVVVKADGLSAGKGVTICQNAGEAKVALEEAMAAKRFGAAGETVVIEEFLRGQEASVHIVTDGKTMLLLPTAQDHKAVGEGDVGPNTGGMGAYSPAPVCEGPMLDKVVRTILVPTLHALRTEGIDYRGAIFVGLMITKGGPRVLEYNARFGDPETEVMMPRLTCDLFDILRAAADGDLSAAPEPTVDPRPCMGVVVASAGYPGTYQVGRKIGGWDGVADLSDVRVFHAGTRRRDGDILTAGGRVLCATALGDDFERARDQTYAAVDALDFEGAFCRRDIGHRVL